METADLLRYVLYAVTVALGVGLAVWVQQTRSLRRHHENQNRTHYRQQPAVVRQPATPTTRVRAVRGVPAEVSMAEAIAGIQLPVHWRPNPPVDVASPLTLTTDQETAEEMADMLTDELSRLGYRISPTGPVSARAVRDTNNITIEVDADPSVATVTTRLTLTEVGNG